MVFVLLKPFKKRLVIEWSGADYIVYYPFKLFGRIIIYAVDIDNAALEVVVYSAAENAAVMHIKLVFIGDVK